MLIDHLVSALQVIAFGFIAFGSVLCLWGVALDAREADVEPDRVPADVDPRSSPHWYSERGSPAASSHG